MWPITRSKRSPKNKTPEGFWRRQELWFIDGEMTGLDPNRDELLQLVAAPMRDGRVLIHDRQEWLIRPHRRMGEDDAVRHHHLTPSILENGISKARFISECQRILDGKILVGHHVGIDLTFLQKMVPLDIHSLDTARLFKSHQAKVQPHFPVEGLDLAHVAKTLEVPIWPPHVALNDVLTCASCFLKMAHDLESRGLSDIADLLKLS